jgi:hypothetical protein
MVNETTTMVNGLAKRIYAADTVSSSPPPLEFGDKAGGRRTVGRLADGSGDGDTFEQFLFGAYGVKPSFVSA